MSYHIGKGKRDPSLFDDVVKDLGIPHEQVLFVDDSRGNAERAADKGLRVFLYQDREQFEHGMDSALRKGSGYQ